MSAPVLHFDPKAGGVSVDLDRLISSRLLLQANSGGGKSRALRYLLEQTHGRVQQLILDPEGEFASLREQFPYVLAGRDGDLPAHPKTAKVLCRRLMELGASAVIDLYDLTLEDRRRFVKLFLEELMHLPRAQWRPLLVAIDEAHVFAPEQGQSESLAAVVALCTQGRKRGYAALLATQRLSKLHKDAAAELLNKMIGRTGLDVDVKRAGDELGFDKEQRQTLKFLEPGTFYVYGPAIAREVTQVRTGAVVTTHPEPGQIVPPAPPPPAKVKALVGQMLELQKEADEELRTIDDYKAKNARLERELREARRGAPAAADPVAIEKAVERATTAVGRDHERETAGIRKAIAAHGAALNQWSGRVQLALSRVTELFDGGVPTLVLPEANGNGTAAPAAPSAARAPARSPSRPAAEARARPVAIVPSEGVSASEQRILNALATFETFGMDEVSRPALAAMARYAQAGRFNNLVGGLRTSGRISYPSEGMVALTDDGRALAHADPVTTLDQLHERWLSVLDASQGKILRALVEAYPDALTREELADRTNYELAGRFNNLVGSLKTAGAVTYPQKGQVRASDLMFPQGLR